MKNDIHRLLREHGPLTGARLQELSGMEIFSLWQSCRLDPEVILRTTASRFLRLDRGVPGFARLSPSIRREFQTYTIVGPVGREGEVEERAAGLRKETGRISRGKLELARKAVEEAVGNLPAAAGKTARERFCFLIAGDITYEMAHAVPRAEVSTGWTVRGSDLDIVAIGDDRAGEDIYALLDQSLHDRKYYYLAHPDWREEIDYIVKPLSRFRRQLAFRSFPDMVACKVAREGRYLYGSLDMAGRIGRLLADQSIPERLDRMEDTARRNRERAERYLLALRKGELPDRYSNLFYTTEERMEDLA